MIPTDAKNTDEKKWWGKKASGTESSDTTSSNSVDNQDHLQQKQHWDKPVILKRGATGRVKWFNFEKGFGFITVDSGDDSVFVHASSIVSILPSIKCYLADGERVEFDIMQGVKGKEAVAVTGVGGMKAGVRRIKSNSPRRRGRCSGTQRTHIKGTLAGDVATKLNLCGESGSKMAKEEGRITGKRDDCDDNDGKTASKRQGVLVRRDRRQGGK